MAIGGVRSFTVIIAVQVEVLPPASVAFRVTVLLPSVAQVNVLGDNDSVKLQLSVLTLSTVDGGTIMVPLAPRLTIAFLHFATGGVTSFNVTVNEQLAVLPPSSAVRVTTTNELCPVRVVLGGGVWVTVIKPVAVQLSLRKTGAQEPTVPIQVALAVISSM